MGRHVIKCTYHVAARKGNTCRQFLVIRKGQVKRKYHFVWGRSGELNIWNLLFPQGSRGCKTEIDDREIFRCLWMMIN